MTTITHTGRRYFLGLLGGTALIGAVPGIALAADKTTTASGFKPDLEIELRAAPDQVGIWSGRPTSVWRYQAKVMKGDAHAVTTLPESYLGPIIRVHKGTKIRIHFYNDLPQASVVHWHGLIVPEVMDGHPRYAIPPGGKYLYEFEVGNRAGTYWFHPHPHGHTGEQVYGGLAGLFIVTDDEERALKLPDGERDVALVIQDRSFTRDNQLRYTGGGQGMGGMMGRMNGFTGDQILVNGHPDYTLTAERKPYRLRFLNGSNSRIYKLAWDDGSPFTVIGTDGGLLAAPVSRPYVTLAPAERIELWVDFSSRKAGEELTLRSLSFPVSGGGGMMGGGMMGGMMGGGGSGLANGAEFSVLKVKVGKGVAQAEKLPERLSIIAAVTPQQAGNFKSPRIFSVTAGRMQWGLNGRVFEMEEVADDEIVKLGTTEVWQLENEATMGMMGGMPHPIHVHGVQYRILERSVHPAAMSGWSSLSAGFVDEGWKDTVLVMPGERVQLLLRFNNYPGLFVYHCHNLEHEDMGMMRNFQIKA
ncbi:MAG: bilirubin oxidase [Gallionellales bacterium 35-53-114]|jgi:FtsP/CotA-like multicopper oxidase with cupredoxin domain|nr:MAG: bilirubin oxidase [Gallionellales bacterium 35-53-114]OYZ64900.1 MAG: bilirubin oxidase [Gallionellales bacterium 24-53-125]OZB07562.1 MAG: bilirubin oxidase [Gallionellales bacterium 39-52-133]HQS58759.1 multicopper oxidase domain-containing protein [Gallionellaceae bacterium]HQS75099.1 multicopper oxidase domain-containing protein [Gallionellaceae bacterium]